MQNREISNVITYQYIGIPYAECNCWALVVRAQHQLYGRQLPDYRHVSCWDTRRVARTFEQTKAYPGWTPVEIFENGDIVLLGRGRTPTHAGVYHNDHILHTTQALNACLTPVELLPNLGYKILKGYTYVDC